MLVLNMLIKPLAVFGIDAEVQNRVGAENYGTYFALLNFTFLFNIILDAGINNFTTKSVAQHPNAAMRYLGKLIGFRFLLFITYTIITVGIALTLGRTKHELFLLCFLIMNQFLITLIAYARSHFGGLLMFKTDAFISVLDRFLLILFCGSVLYFNTTDTTFKIEWYIWIQSICYSISFLVAAILLIRKIGIPTISFRPIFAYAIIKQSLPYALLILLMMIYTRTDSVMVELLHQTGKEQAGIYAQGFRILDALFMFAMIFSGLLFPIFSKLIAEKLTVNPLLQTSGKLLIGGAISIAVLTYFHSEMILGWIYDNHVSESTLPFQLLMFSFIGMCSTLVFGTLLTANGSLRFLNISSFIGIIINLSLNLFLIPTHGASGAAIATVITQGLISIIQITYCLRLFQMSIKPIIVIQFMLYITIIVSLNYFFIATSVMNFILLAFLQFISMLALRLIDIRGLKKAFKT